MADLVEFSDLIGTPFKYGGRDSSGLDCWGLIMEFFHRLGVEIEDTTEVYTEVYATKDNQVFDKYRSNNWTEVGSNFKEGDVLLFRTGVCGVPTHCGIYIKGDRILHALKKLGTVLSPFRHFKSKFLKAYRHKCLE
jgi:cell wall-associated NlpC family hydrolase